MSLPINNMLCEIGFRKTSNLPFLMKYSFRVNLSNGWRVVVNVVCGIARSVLPLTSKSTTKQSSKINRTTYFTTAEAARSARSTLNRVRGDLALPSQWSVHFPAPSHAPRSLRFSCCTRNNRARTGNCTYLIACVLGPIRWFTFYIRVQMNLAFRYHWHQAILLVESRLRYLEKSSTRFICNNATLQ